MAKEEKEVATVAKEVEPRIDTGRICRHGEMWDGRVRNCVPKEMLEPPPVLTKEMLDSLCRPNEEFDEQLRGCVQKRIPKPRVLILKKKPAVIIPEPEVEVEAEARE